MTVTSETTAGPTALSSACVVNLQPNRDGCGRSTPSRRPRIKKIRLLIPIGRDLSGPCAGKPQPLGWQDASDASLRRKVSVYFPHISTMQALASQEPFDNLHAVLTTPDDILDIVDGNSSRFYENAHRMRDPTAAARMEITRLLEIATRANAAKRRLVQHTRLAGASLLPATPCFELPAPVKFSRRNKGGTMPGRRVR